MLFNLNTNLRKETPPRPVPKFQVVQAVPLQDPDGAQLLRPLLVMFAGEVTSTKGLEDSDDLRQLRVSVLLKLCQHTSSEEDLGLADAVGIFVQLQIVQLQQINIPHYSLEICSKRSNVSSYYVRRKLGHFV